MRAPGTSRPPARTWIAARSLRGCPASGAGGPALYGDSSARPTDEQWARRVERLEAEVAGLRRSLRTRGVIEQAKGVLAERLGIDVEEAFTHLSRMSQKANVRLVNLAADVLEQRADTVRRADTAQRADVAHRADPPAEAVAAPATQVRHARARRRVESAAQASDDPQAFVDALFDEALAELRPVAVAVFLTEADGGQRLLAAHGWPARIVADWAHAPSAVRNPAAAVMRDGRARWLRPGDAPDLIRVGPDGVRAVLPVAVRGTTIAALEVVVREDGDLEGGRHLLADTADVVGRWLAGRQDVTSGGPLHSGDDRWVEALVDAAPGPAAVLTPLRDDGDAICDFRIDYLNQAATAAWSPGGVSPLGRRLLDVAPRLLADGGFNTFVRSFEGDVLTPAMPMDSRRASRIGTRLVVMWSPERDGRGEAGAVLAGLERLDGVAWAEWDQALKPLSMSTALYRMLGQEPGATPIKWDQLLGSVAPDDRAPLSRAMRRMRNDGVEVDLEVRLRGADADRRVVRVVAVARPADPNPAILTILQDLTEPRRRDEALARAADRLAGQRLQFALERSQTDQLRSELFPAALTQIRHGDVMVNARHAAPSPMHRFRGDFYDVSQVGQVLSIVIGDVFGSGVPAASAMIRLRHGVRSLALAGLGPGAILETLNRELVRDPEPPLASLVVAQLSGDGTHVRWAQAGHYSPLLVRDGRARSLRRARGDALGLFVDADFTETATRLITGDLLVLFTDGVLNRQDFHGDPVRRLASALREAYRPGRVDTLMDMLRQPSGDEACLVTLERA